MSRKSYRVRFPGGCGFELAGIIDRPDHQDPVPVAVFSHCFTCNKDLKAIVRISRALAEAGIAVLRFDMTGLGDSDGDFSRTSFSTNLLDLQAAIRFAATELGPVTALLGHSFGGAASLAVAGSRTSADQAEDDPPADQLRHLAAVITLAAPSETRHLAELLSRMNPAIQAEGHGQVSIGGRSWTIRREMLADFRSHQLPDLVAKIDVPTLLLHSPVDKTVPYHHALRLMSLIQTAPDRSTPVSLFSLADADHLLADRAEDLPLVASIAASFINRYAAVK